MYRKCPGSHLFAAALEKAMPSSGKHAKEKSGNQVHSETLRGLVAKILNIGKGKVH